MLWVFILFTLALIAIIAPYLLGQSEQSINEMEASLDTRIKQLKRDFQFQNKELKRRLKSGDLDEIEWQKLSDELKSETALSLAGTERAANRGVANRSPLVFSGLIVFAALVAFITYETVGFNDEQIQQTSVVNALKKDISAIEQYREALENEPTQDSINDYYLALRERVDLAPEDIKSWRDLTFFNANYGREDQAMETLKVAIKKHPDSLDLKVDKAQLLTITSDTDKIIEGHRLLSEILEQDPEHQGALFIKGDSAFRIGMYDIAIQSWQKLREAMTGNQPMLDALDERIRLANERQQGVSPQQQQTDQSEIASASRPGVQVAISIAQELMDRLDGNETMFIFARAENGPQLPVAVAKIKVGDLTGPVLLDDSMAMQPQFALSNYDAITITARISFTENAIAVPGDLEGQSSVVERPFPSEPVMLSIDTVVE